MNRRRNLLLAEYEQIAWKLFAQYGFREVTVDEIAEAAGVSARTLFRYFPTKEDFLLRFSLFEVPDDEAHRIAEDNARRVFNFPRS